MLKNLLKRLLKRIHKEKKIDKDSNNVRILQEEKLEIDERIEKLTADNSKLKAHGEVLKIKELAFE